MYTQTTTGNNSGYQAEEPYQEQIPMNGRTTDSWIPSRAEILREYPITIEFLTIGCVVSVGCKKIPFTMIGEAMDRIKEYIDNPYETKQKWERTFEQNK